MTLIAFLARSRATGAFRDAVSTFLQDGRPNDRLHFTPLAPPVKVARTVTKLLEEHPELEIESVEIHGTSGCEYFRGDATIRTATEERRVAFWWDCKWRAIDQGWTDYFGFPDQGRAAREFDHDCFRRWEVEEVRAVSGV